MKLTAATVKRIAREKGISITMVSVCTRYGILDMGMKDLPLDMIERNIQNNWDNPGRGNTAEVNRAIRKYNRQARKIVAALRNAGFFMWGRCFGNGEWSYTFQKPTYSDELVLNNID